MGSARRGLERVSFFDRPPPPPLRFRWHRIRLRKAAGAFYRDDRPPEVMTEEAHEPRRALAYDAGRSAKSVGIQTFLHVYVSFLHAYIPFFLKHRIDSTSLLTSLTRSVISVVFLQPPKNRSLTSLTVSIAVMAGYHRHCQLVHS